MIHSDLVVKCRYELATIEQVVKVRLLFLAIFHEIASDCAKLTLNNLSIWRSRIVPSGQELIKDNAHRLLEIISYFSPGLKHFVNNLNRYLQPFGRCGA
ncbi:MAG: hypothetical protein WBP47_15760, partial [Candidatus Promineifilaceae bacterium]